MESTIRELEKERSALLTRCILAEEQLAASGQYLTIKPEDDSIDEK